MRPRALPLAHLPDLVATLFADRNAVVLTPATADLTWAASAAWAFARAATRGGRRVTLVDLSLEQPALDEGDAARLEDGIVDAFVYGASLSHVAQEQDVPGLHYIGAGTYPADPVEIWSNPRWRRLSRGYATERALLALFVPPTALPLLGFEPDGIVVLAPDGFAPSGALFPGIAARVAAGTPLLAVVTDTPQPALPSPATTPAHRRRSPVATGPGIHWSRWGISIGAAFAGLALVAVLAIDAPSPEPMPPPAVAAPASPPVSRERAVAVPVGDSLFYSVQVAAFNTLARAMTYAEELEGTRWTAAVTPVRLGNQSLWYRVLVGAFSTPAAADSALRQLWREGLVERPQGAIVRTPQAFALDAPRPADQRDSLVAGLRARGVPAYIVEAPGGAVRPYLGAFETPEQARLLDSLLGAAGLTASLVSRMGIAR